MELPTAVLIINYRVYDELDRALTSLEPFLRPGDEVVVVDQAADRGNLTALARRHPLVQFVASPSNVGFAAGVNLAARHSTAPFLLLLNPDATVDGPVVEVLERWLDETPDVGIVGPRVTNHDGSVQASARRFPGPSAAIAGRSTWLTRRFPRNWLTRLNLPARTATEPVEVDWVAGSCLMTRRDLFDRLGGMDEAFFLYWEDADFCHRARQAGARCVYLPTVDVRHAGGRSTRFDPAPAIRAFHASAFHLYWKHSGWIGRALAPLAHAALWTRGEILARRAARRHAATS